MAVPILTTPFQSVLDSVLSFWRPEAKFPMIVIGHPIQNIPNTSMKEIAQQITEKTLRYLESAEEQ